MRVYVCMCMLRLYGYLDSTEVVFGIYIPIYIYVCVFILDIFRLFVCLSVYLVVFLLINMSVYVYIYYICVCVCLVAGSMYLCVCERDCVGGGGCAVAALCPEVR